MTDKSTKLNPIKLAADREAFEKLEPAIHTKARLAIVSLLAANESLSFIELRDSLRLTDGNLAAHLRALGDAWLDPPAQNRQPQQTHHPGIVVSCRPRCFHAVPGRARTHRESPPLTGGHFFAYLLCCTKHKGNTL